MFFSCKIIKYLFAYMTIATNLHSFYWHTHYIRSNILCTASKLAAWVTVLDQMFYFSILLRYCCVSLKHWMWVQLMLQRLFCISIKDVWPFSLQAEYTLWASFTYINRGGFQEEDFNALQTHGKPIIAQCITSYFCETV